MLQEELENFFQTVLRKDHHLRLFSQSYLECKEIVGYEIFPINLRFVLHNRRQSVKQQNSNLLHHEGFYYYFQIL